MSRETRTRPVFSIWAWLVLSPYLLIALGGVDDAATAREWLLGAIASVVVHLVLLAVYLGVGAIEVAVAARPALRWTIVAVALALIAIGRPALISVTQHLLGVDLVPTRYGLARIILNGVVIGVGTLLMYVLLEVAQRNVDGRRRLLVVTEQLESQAERVESTADRVAADFQQEVRGPVLDALGSLVARDLSDAELASELQWVAHSVVRPLSHKVTDAGLEEALGDARFQAVSGAEPDLEASAGPLSVRGLLRPTRIVPAPAWLTTLVAMLLLLPPELNVQGLLPGLALIVGGVAVSFVGSVAIRAMPLPRSTPLAIVVLSIEQLVVACFVVWVLLGPVPLSPLIGYYLVYGAIGYVTVAIVLAIIHSGMRELAGHQEATAAALANAERRAFRARQRLASLSRDTGRLLHTEVQGDLVATYLQLKLGTAGEDVLGRLIDRVDRLLHAPGAGAADALTSATAIRDGFRASLNAWSLSLDLTVDVEPAALDRLAELARTAAVAHDALTEGLTNAVRHSRSERAAVRIGLMPDGDQVEVVVASPGRITASDRGIGLRDLDARAREVSLTQDGGDVVLRVVV
ncbi:MAG TPA: hypothetical protein VNQ52_02250 [Microbacteriaceae bacterium]|nr:hypothetical protein [Microbacteriaceae bacterium]